MTFVHIYIYIYIHTDVDIHTKSSIFNPLLYCQCLRDLCLSQVSKMQQNRATAQLSSSLQSSFTSRLLLLLTLLPLSLALLAFFLRWKGDAGLPDPTTTAASTVSHWAPRGSRLQNREVFPGMESSPSPKAQHVSRPDCAKLLRSSSPSFPYYRDWKPDFNADLKPKVLFLVC